MLFLVTLPIWITVIFITAAVLPAAILMRYIYNKDRVEKEPTGLLVTLLLMGVLAAFLAGILEMIGQNIIAWTSIVNNRAVYILILAFLIVAVAEEGMKYLLMYFKTWRSPNFNYTFDGIVYAVFVSLGFAAIENIKYVYTYGLGVAFQRAFLSIPGHMGFAVVFGYFYSRAKRCENHGDLEGKKRNFRSGFLASVFLHGFYDTCALMGTPFWMFIFVIFVIVLYRFVFKLVKSESEQDRPL